MKLVAGIDEVGRGPLLGNVVACAVILNPDKPIPGLNDSKKLTEKKRNYLFEQIMEHAVSVSLGSATPAEIDHINILQASLLAMERAFNGLEVKPDNVLIDGTNIPKNIHAKCEAIPQGDNKYECIQAASIIAKVTRDAEMYEFDRIYPEYGFAKHKGYPTKLHLEAISQYGVLKEHRRSFRPVREAEALEN